MTKTEPTGRLAEMAKAMKTRGDKLVIPTVEQYLISIQDDTDRKPEVLHVSEMSKKNWCERASYFRIKTGKWQEQPFKFSMQNIFEEGNQIHAKWQGWLKESGKLWGQWECAICHNWATGFSADLDKCYSDDEEWTGYCPVGYGEPLAHDWQYREVELQHGLIYGHEDGALEDRLIEFKSVGLGTLRVEHPELLGKHYLTVQNPQVGRGYGAKKVYDIDGIWKNLKQPFRSHVRQANLYLWLAEMMGLPFRKCSIVYEFKPNQQTAEFVIRASEEVWYPLVERASIVERALEDDHPIPECPYKGCKACKSYEETATRTGTTIDGDASGAKHRTRRRITRKGNPLVRPASA